MSLAAQANAPDRRLPMRSIIAMIVGFSLAVIVADSGGGFLLTICIFVGTFLLSIYLAIPTDGEKAEQRLWSSQWYCKKCGHIFFEAGGHAPLPGKPSTPSASRFVSPVLKPKVNSSRQQYVDRVLNPVQRAASATERDLAGLAAIKNHVAVDGSFDPEEFRCDLGIVSRLASLGLIAYDKQADRFFLPNSALADESDELPKRGWWQRTFGY